MFCQEGKIKEKQIFSKKTTFPEQCPLKHSKAVSPPAPACKGTLFSHRRRTRNKVPGNTASAHRERRRISFHEQPGYSASPTTSLCKVMRQMQNISSNIFPYSANAILH